jgi:hypothetical protein
MGAPHSQFEAELQTLLQEEIERLIGNLVTPGAINDFNQYQFVVGQVVALKRAMSEYCDEANTLVSKR